MASTAVGKNGESPAEFCARRILETVPSVMRLIRQEMRGATDEKLSVPQFRVLAFLGRHRGASLSSVAEHLGVADATASTMVERLVRRGFLCRETHPEERRRVAIDLTAEGLDLLTRARAKARTFLTGCLASLEEPEVLRLVEALDLLSGALEARGSKEVCP